MGQGGGHARLSTWQWEDVWQGIAELAVKGLGLPEFVGPEEQTLVLRPPRFVQVVESSTDGMTWKEVLRAPLGTPFECEDVCGEGDKYYRIYVSERGSTSPGAGNGTIGEKP